MLKPQNRWHIPEMNEIEIQEMSKNFGIHPIIARILLLRGMKDDKEIQRFLHTEKADFHDPFLLDGMEKAVKRIQSAIIKNEKILIYGDYDADGVTSTTILYKTLKSLQANFAYYIPNRFSEGYGLNMDAIEKAAEKGFKVIITVDTGISAIEEAELAKDLGLTLIITDHHEPKEVLPDAYTVINPKKKGDTYPFKFLAGVGVAFKLAHALLGRVPLEYLDLAAVGTISDLVPLLDENRIIVSRGLQIMQNTKHVGLRALLQKSGIANKEITAGQIGFSVGPRINASGRLDTANHAVRLLIAENEEESNNLANILDEINKERQAVVEGVAKEAIEEITNQHLDKDKVLIIAKEGWNEGVIGIVASRIVEKFYRPAIVLSINPETKMAKGSARSIPGYDIYQALTKAKDILPNFGGHPAAAGLNIQIDDIKELRIRLNVLANEWLKEEDFIPVQKVDAVCRIEDITTQLIQEMEKLAPFGIGNHQPKLLIEQGKINNLQLLGNEKKHLKLIIGNHTGTNSIEAILFRKGELNKQITVHSEVKLLGELSLNSWNGTITPQIIVKDMHIPTFQVFDWRKLEWNKKLNELEEQNTILLYDEAIDNGKVGISKENWEIISYNSNFSEKWFFDKENLVLLHLPPSIDKLKKLVKLIPNMQRIYCIFDTSGRKTISQHLNRDIFKQAYIQLKQSPTAIDERDIEHYLKNLRISSENIKIILRVFSELGFIIWKDGKIALNPKPEKKDLKESLTYQQYVTQKEIMQLFVHSNHQRLTTWFLELSTE